MTGSSFRTKLLASHVALVAFVVLALVVDLGRFLARDLEAQLDRRLEAQARGAEPWLRGARHPAKVAERMAAMVGADVTIFERDGAVYADTRDEGAPPVGAAKPPEVDAALQGKVGTATRPAGHDAVETRFVAVQVEDGHVVRLAVPLASIRATVDATHSRLLTAFCVAIVVALALAYFAAQVAARPLRTMTETAERIGRGDYDVESKVASPDEFGILSQSLAKLASELKARIGDLTDERDRLSTILSSMAEGVLVLDDKGRIVLANPASSTVLNVRGPLEGRSYDDVFADGALKDAVARAVDGSRERDDEVEGSDTAGRVLAVVVRRLGDKSENGHVVVIRDMTRVRRLLAMRHDLVANVSHELRTPVTSIQGYAETLLRGNPDEATAREFLGIIHRHSERIGKLVSGLLQLSELEAMAPEKVVRENVDVSAVVRQVVVAAGPRADAKGVHVSMGPAGPAAISGDPLGLEQIADNLLDNAIKYCDAGAHVVVRVDEGDGRVRLVVEDDGPGIDAHHLPKLFDRFYRVESAESKRRGGSGLGLAIVKHLVESTGGTIDVTSTKGKGTVFTVSWPKATP
ncbi:MAG: ATP-binding protein [Polyangiaceae bacterium]